MYPCPHCGEPGITAWQKANVTYLLPAQCRRCKKLAGIRASHYYLTWLPSLLVLIGLAILAFEPRFLTWMGVPFFGLLAVGLCLVAVVYVLRICCVPLERR